MAEFRQFEVYFWSDGYIQSLEPLEKLLFMYLFTGPESTLHGLYNITHKTIAFHTGLDMEFIDKTLLKFERDRKAIMRGELVWVINMYKHQPSKSSTLVIYRERHMKNIRDCPLKDAFMDFIQTGKIPQDFSSIGYGYPTDTLPIPYPYPITTLSLKRKEKEKEKEKEIKGKETESQGGHTPVQGYQELNEFPEHPLSKAFIKAFSILPHDLKRWTEACQELTRQGITEDEVRITKLVMDERKLSYSGPWSIVKTAIYVHIQHIKRGPIFTQKALEPDELKTLVKELVEFQKGQKTDGHNLPTGGSKLNQ